MPKPQLVPQPDPQSLDAFLHAESHTVLAPSLRWPQVVKDEIEAVLRHVDAGGRARKNAFLRRLEQVHGICVSKHQLDHYVTTKLGRKSWLQP